jgi:hypothetical protein
MWMFGFALACVQYNSTKSGTQDTAEPIIDIDEFIPSGTSENCDSTQGRNMGTTLSAHFEMWLNSQYPDSNFVRDDLVGGSFGGLLSNDDCLTHTPVLFIHGNSDRAIEGLLGGWTDSREIFLRNGYRSAELYATTYGSPDTQTPDQYAHTQDNILQVRRFIEAVLEYTGSEQVNIVAHSLGVTLARRAILGGNEMDADGSIYDIGPTLTDQINVFVGIAGANQGLASCAFANTTVCGRELGLYPGTWSNGTLQEQSRIIQTINQESHYEGQTVYSIWGEADGLIGNDDLLDCLLYGANTCLIPGHDGDYNEYLSHMDIRDQTGQVQVDMIQGIYSD